MLIAKIPQELLPMAPTSKAILLSDFQVVKMIASEVVNRKWDRFMQLGRNRFLNNQLALIFVIL
jgi:hypothetical protein